MNPPFTDNNKPMTCQKHGFSAQGICLVGSPMTGRVLCRVCKQNLSREQLLEVISLTDFQSGNYLGTIDSLMNQPQEDSLEAQIADFYQNLEETLIDVVRNSKEKALKAGREKKASPIPSFDIEYQRGLLKTKHENIGKNWQENIHNDALLNDLAKNFADLSQSSTTLMSSSSNFRDALIETLKVDGKIVTDFEKFLDDIVKKLKPAQEEEKKAAFDTEEKEVSRRHVSRNRRRIQDIIDTEEPEPEAEKKPSKKVKPSLLSLNEEVMEINEEEAKADLNPNLPKITCAHTIVTNHESLAWGGLCYIPNKKHLVSGGFEGTLCVWDIETKASVFSTNTNSKIYKILYIDNKEILLASTEEGLVHIFDVRNNYTLLISHQAHPKQAFSIAYLSKIDLIATCGEDGNIMLWTFNQETNEFSKKRMLDTNKKQVSCLLYIEDQNFLIAGMCKGGHIMVFQPDRSKCFRIMKAHNKEKSVDSLVYVPEWKQLVSGSEDSYIKFWDFSDFSNPNGPNSLKAIRREESFIEAMVVFPEENYLINTNIDECFSVWDLSKDKVVGNFRGHSNEGNGEALIYIKERKELVTAFAEEISFWKVDFIKNK